MEHLLTPVVTLKVIEDRTISVLVPRRSSDLPEGLQELAVACGVVSLSGTWFLHRITRMQPEQGA